MAIVGKYKIGNTKIVICDDYIVKSEKEVNEILDRITKIVMPYYENGLLLDSKPLEHDEPIINVGIDSDFDDF